MTERDMKGLGELAAIEAEVLSAHEAAASEIRTALAEGDFAARMFANHGHEARIPPETWRTTEGLECIKAGYVRIQFPHSIEALEGRAFVMEIDFITWWLSTHAPKPCSKIGVNFIMPSPRSTKSSILVDNKAKVADVAFGMLPPWLTPMEAVASIVSRDTNVVACASPGKNSVRTYVCDYVGPDGKRVSSTETLPPGMTLRWLDTFAAYGGGALPTDAALSQLLSGLRSGQLVARAEWTATGERRDMGADEWAGLVFDTLPGQERILLPHRTFPGQLPRRPEKRWNVALLPLDALVLLWPAPQQQSVQPDVRPLSGDLARTSDRLSLPTRKRGPKGGLTDAAAQRMANDMREGRQTLSTLNEMKQESLAAAYGVRSRDTALKALRRAAAIVETSPTDK